MQNKLFGASRIMLGMRLLLISMLIIALLANACGCLSTNTSESATTNEKTSGWMQFKVYRGTEYGLDLSINLFDAQDRYQPDNGQLSVTLWDKANTMLYTQGKIIQQWNLPVASSDFDNGLLVVSIRYEGYEPEAGKWAYIELVFNASDYSLKAGDVTPLVKEPGCCENP